MVPRDVMLRGLNLIHSPGMLSVAEAEFLYDTAASFTSPVRWVELGVWCGRSLWAAGCGLPVMSEILGIDLFNGLVPTREGSDVITSQAPERLQEELACGVVHGLYAMRNDMGIRLKSCAVNKRDSSDSVGCSNVDVLVVDAAHDYDSVRRDLDAWVPKMKPGGLIIGHDYGGKFHGVTRAFDERFGDKCETVPGTRFVKVRL